jgi:hypothetical protein
VYAHVTRAMLERSADRYGVALNPNSSSVRKPVTFWSNLEPASDETSIRNSEPM